MSSTDRRTPALPPLKQNVYLVLAHTIDHLRRVPGLFDPSRPLVKVLGAYESEREGEEAEIDVFNQFLAEWASTPKDAQRFYDDIIVLKVQSDVAMFKLSGVYGELLRFPNPAAFSPVDLRL